MRRTLNAIARALAKPWLPSERTAIDPDVRPPVARDPLYRKPTDIRDLLDLASESLGSKLKAAGMSMDLKLPPQPLTVILDRSGIQEVLSRVVDLACRVMPAGSTLQLLARVDGAHAVVNFMDSGPSEEPCLGRFFSSAFTRNWRRTDEAHANAIASIALCEQIVGDHRGRIYAAPSPLGSLGLTLRLPLCQLLTSHS